MAVTDSGAVRRPVRAVLVRLLVIAIGAGLCLIGLTGLSRNTAGLQVHHTWSGQTPATITRLPGTVAAPAVVIVHGLAGSQQVMDAQAVTLARAGLIAVTIDLPGHGRNPAPWSRDEVERLDAAVSDGVALARRVGNGRVGLLGHSLGGFSVLMQAANHPGIDATVVLSAAAPVDPDPQVRDLLVLAGQFEPGLQPGLREFARKAGGGSGELGTTYGSIGSGTARRAAIVPGVEHVGILFSATALAASRDWLTAALTGHSGAPTLVDTRLPWLLTTFAGGGLLVAALALLLPRLAPIGRERAVGLGRPGWWTVAVAGYLFGAVAAAAAAVRGTSGLVPLAYGSSVAMLAGGTGAVVSAGLLVLLIEDRRRAGDQDWWGVLRSVVAGLRGRRIAASLALGAGLAAVLFAVVGVPTQLYLLQVRLIAARLDLLPVVLVATTALALANAILLGHPGAPSAAPAVLTLGFGLGLLAAVLGSLGRLGFLVLVGPLLLLGYAVLRVFGYLAWRRTGSWLPGVALEAGGLAWLITAVFPLTG